MATAVAAMLTRVVHHALTSIIACVLLFHPTPPSSTPMVNLLSVCLSVWVCDARLAFNPFEHSES